MELLNRTKGAKTQNRKKNRKDTVLETIIEEVVITLLRALKIEKAQEKVITAKFVKWGQRATRPSEITESSNRI